MSSRRTSRRIAWFVVGALVAVLAPGCSDGKDRSEPTSTSRPAAATTAPVAPAADICNGDNEANEDDDGAVQALLQQTQLPPGTWTPVGGPPCPWALSADELLLVPECLAAASSAKAPANDQARNGNARATFTRTGGIQLDDRIEIYTSSQNLDAIRAILAGPSVSACYAAAVQRAAAERGVTVTDVSVRSFAVQPTAAALGLGFPATAGYAADPGFVNGVNISFTRTAGGSSTPVAMRVITFGSGGLMSTLTLIGATPADLDAVDFTATLRAAAKDFKTMFGGQS